jgi:hypothetical protein
VGAARDEREVARGGVAGRYAEHLAYTDAISVGGAVPEGGCVGLTEVVTAVALL